MRTVLKKVEVAFVYGVGGTMGIKYLYNSLTTVTI